MATDLNQSSDPAANATRYNEYLARCAVRSKRLGFGIAAALAAGAIAFLFTPVPQFSVPVFIFSAIASLFGLDAVFQHQQIRAGRWRSLTPRSGRRASDKPPVSSDDSGSAVAMQSCN